jgi:hypothetical protein
MNALLAITWEPELRGILIVIIAVATLCGSVYLILGTNLGARLGFLVTLTGLAGWMALMGGIWWIYGIGLKGPEPSWEAIPGKTVIQDSAALRSAGVLDALPTIPTDSSFTEEATLIDERFVAEGWVKIAESEPTFGQAGSSAGELLVETETFATGEFQVVNVFDTGGERYPKIGDSLDFVAFFHKPHYAVVEVAPLEQLRPEPGRAPTPPAIDTTRQHQYVYMVRDLGAKRQPAALITIGSTTVFLLLCWMLHRRDRLVAENRSRQLVPAG